MNYDLLIRNGRVVDGSGTPGFMADVGIRNGRIVEIGRLRGTARRVIDAQGLVVAPGFIDSHCHYDAQVLWDPLCEFSCYHGVTTVIMGNCSLSLAPVRPGTGERVKEFLSYVEAIPMQTLSTVPVTWESFGQYMDAVDRRLGVNAVALIGHTAVRHYVMGADSQSRTATPAEIGQMCALVREGMEAGAHGLSFSMNHGHYDPQGVMIPSPWADEAEVFALSEVLGDMGTGIIQAGSAYTVEEKNRLMSRLSEATGRPVIYIQLAQTAKRPDGWKVHMAMTDEAVAKGLRAYPTCSPVVMRARFTLHNTQAFRGVPTWHPILFMSDAEKLQAYADPGVRDKLHVEAVEWVADIVGNTTLSRHWPDTVSVEKAALPANRQYEGMTIREIAAQQGKRIIDAFLDLAIAENLDTQFVQLIRGFDREVMSHILNYPNAYIGLSDAGAHVQFRGNYGYCSELLGYWVRKQKIMSLEQAVKRLTFDIAHGFGIYDRGLLRPGMAADLAIFDPETIQSLPEEKVHDLPGGAWRMKELAVGMHYTVVNGEVLLEQGRHTGALPGRMLRNSLYREREEALAAKAA